ncbi:MAG: hypothetical protein KDI13_05950 [Alphaproteobacteria bacterium]|nr:hypothetical protein [Alphaproteobacteria bacterium]
MKSPKTTKKAIDLTALRDLAVLDVQNEWFLADLFDLTSDYHDLFSDICDVQDYNTVLSWCLHVLGESPSGRAMLKEAMEADWKIGLEDLHGGEYCIDVERKVLLLDNNTLVPSALGRSSYFRNMTVVTLIKALRDVWQEKRHGAFDVYYRPEHIMTLERVRAADCAAVSILVGWELRNEEHGAVWRHLIGSENGDMAMVYSGHLERDPSARFSGRALAAAFKQWFKDEQRVNSCDHDTLEYLDDVLAESSVLNPFGKKKPGRMAVEVLSCLPDKTAYLQGMGAEIMADPLYCGMDDPINQSHLFHILYDLEAVIVGDVPFRDADLARRIFPE